MACTVLTCPVSSPCSLLWSSIKLASVPPKCYTFLSLCNSALSWNTFLHPPCLIRSTTSLPWIPKTEIGCPSYEFTQHPNLYLFCIALACLVNCIPHLNSISNRSKTMKVLLLYPWCWMNDLPCFSQQTHALYS